MRILLAPFSVLFGAIVKIRNLAFDLHLLKEESLPVPVLSVGNLSVGGTGKTPLTMLLIEQLKARGLKVGLISRGYGGQYKDLAEVDLNETWKSFGDEPVMIKTRFPDVPIFLSPKRVKAAKALLEKNKVDLIIADDAFQHRYLKRNCDVVLIDSTQPEADYKMLPQGMLRENFAALNRANWIVITKTNLLSENEILGRLKFLNSNIKAERILSGDLVAQGVFTSDGHMLTRESLKELVLVSGIGRPQAFEKGVKDYLQSEIKKHFIFKDHFDYTDADLEKIFTGLQPDQKLITTEKDYVRLKGFSQYKNRFLVFRVNMELKGDADEFWTQIASLGL